MFAVGFIPLVFLSTLLGGFFALRLRDRLHLILGFSAGAVVGVALFDLLPEAFADAKDHSARATGLLVGVGFLFYLVLDRAMLFHAQAEQAPRPQLARRGALGAASLVMHSVFDGVAIGFAFQVSHAIGLTVAAAVLAHDFSDGINTTNVVLKSGGTRTFAAKWLLIDALAPGVGIASTLLWQLPHSLFSSFLAVFAGFFLYLGASDLVPESHHAHPRLPTTAATVLGALFIFAATLFVG